MTKDCILQNTNGGILFRNPSIVMHILHRKKGVLFGRKMEKEGEVVDLSWSDTLICWLGCRIAQRSCILKSENVHW